MRYGHSFNREIFAMAYNPVRTAAVIMVAPLAALTLLTSACAATCTPDEASLDRAIAATLGAVRGNDANALLDQMSNSGVAFGTDGPLVSYKTLAANFNDRTGRYCDLFNCNGQDGDMHHLFEMGQIDKSVDVKHGLAGVTINANSNDELDLSYRWGDQCRWELTGIGYP